MRVYSTLIKRELGSYFGSFSGYILVATVLFLTGLGFTNLLMALSGESTDIPLTALFYQTYYFWIILLFLAPGITMRSFAHERASGTFECLLTLPITEWQLVISKFLGALLLFGICWIPLIGCLVVVNHFAGESSGLSAGALLGTFSGILLIGSLFTSMGCFASALTKNQSIAAMLSFGMGLGVFVVGYLIYTGQIDFPEFNRYLGQLAMINHMEEFVRGTIDLRYIVFYLTLTSLFLVTTTHVVESKRWR